MIDATGSELLASDAENPGLFWALKGGGGGNFGIATEFLFRAYPVNHVIVFRIQWKTVDIAAALAKWQELAPHAPDEVGCVRIDSGRSGINGVRCVGQFLPRNAGETPSDSELLRLLRPLTSIGSASVTKKSLSFIEACRYFAGDGDKKRVSQG